MDSSSQVYELKNCRWIADYLENGKDDNYLEEFILPDKVLCKFALLLDKSMKYWGKAYPLVKRRPVMAED